MNNLYNSKAMTRKEYIIKILQNRSVLKNYGGLRGHEVSHLEANEFNRVADEILALPLDVPSDEEVEKSCTQVLTPRIASFLQGARWMRKEIIQRNTHEIDHK